MAENNHHEMLADTDKIAHFYENYVREHGISVGWASMKSALEAYDAASAYPAQKWSDFKSVLSKNGVFVVAERTSRSASSYPLPDMVSRYWADIFSQPRETRRFAAAELSEMMLSVSGYGEHVALSKETYLDAVKKNQLVGVWMLKSDVINEWVDNQNADETDSFTVFEEFWLYLYRKMKPEAGFNAIKLGIK